MSLGDLAQRLLIGQLGAGQIVRGADSWVATVGQKTYAVSLPGVRAYLDGVNEDDRDATFPDVSVEEAAIRLLGIELESVAAVGTGARLDADGDIHRVGAQPSV